jgi:glutamate carboxypeptidase
VIARRGDESWTLRTTGTPAHSSQIFTPEVGAGAVYEASRVLSEFYRQLAGEQFLTFNPGLALGGTAVMLDSTAVRGSAEGKTNVVAGAMTVTGDLRTISPEQLARAKQAMRSIVAKHLPRTTATLTFDPGYPPMAPTAGNKQLLALYDRVSRDLGLWPVTAADPAKAGAADVSFVAALVPMKIDGVGLSGHDDHTTGETADLRMLPVQTKRAAILLHRLAAAGHRSVLQ